MYVGDFRSDELIKKRNLNPGTKKKADGVAKQFPKKTPLEEKKRPRDKETLAVIGKRFGGYSGNLPDLPSQPLTLQVIGSGSGVGLGRPVKTGFPLV